MLHIFHSSPGLPLLSDLKLSIFLGENGLGSKGGQLKMAVFQVFGNPERLETPGRALAPPITQMCMEYTLWGTVGH